MTIDLRTDFISTPTDEMVDAMTRAARMPPSFGLRDDPFVAELEALAARMLGKDDALFCPTCACANQIAVHLHCRPGESLVADAGAHVATSEAGGFAALSGAALIALPARPARPSDDELRAAFDEASPQRSRSALLWLENTHVGSGGTVLPVGEMDRWIAAARGGGAAVHLDGSRLFNAAAFLGVDARRMTRDADTVSVSLNKGLAAPMGAVLAGSRDLIARAERVRQMFGAGWRPAHIPAAAGVVALRTMVERIGDDHATARALADGLRGIDGLSVDPEQVQTNIVFADLDPAAGTSHALLERMRTRGVLAMPLSAHRIRLVLWHGIGPREVAAALDAVRDAMRALAARGP